jgi:hypothetical protein
VAVVVFVNAAIHVAPQAEAILRTDSMFQISSSTIPVSDFNKIKLGGADTAEVFASSTFSVTVEGREQDIQNANIYVDQGVFRVSREKEQFICLFCFRKPLHFTIFAPSIEEIRASGASDIAMKQFSISEFAAELSGASSLVFSGNASSTVFELSGASRIDASQAEIGDVQASLSGASSLYLNEINELIVEASGASHVYYNSAKSVNEKMSGASNAESGWMPLDIVSGE